MDADETTLAELRRALDAAHPPLSTRTMADAAWAWRNVDAELAMLTYDSLEGDAAPVREGSLTERAVVFEIGDVSVEVELGRDSLVGQLVPPMPGEVVLYGATGELARTQADEVGCFSFPLDRSGPMRLHCRTSSADVLTEWLRI